jgi:molybdopterin-guanine dinucleotide biosynthesis protein A
MSEPEASAIVLAGGRSRRFGRDKLAERLDGGTLLDHAIDAVRPVSAEIVVVAAPDEPRLVPDDVVLVRDPTSFGGPLVGVLTGLGRVSRDLVLIVGGDMPTMVPSVLGAMIDGLRDPSFDAVALARDATLAPLPVAVRTGPARTAAERLVLNGERRLGALLEALAIAVIEEATWRTLDPGGRTLYDVDTPGDLR